jgi:hypothetical protein
MRLFSIPFSELQKIVDVASRYAEAWREVRDRADHQKNSHTDGSIDSREARVFAALARSRNPRLNKDERSLARLQEQLTQAIKKHVTAKAPTVTKPTFSQGRDQKPVPLVKVSGQTYDEKSGKYVRH